MMPARRGVTDDEANNEEDVSDGAMRMIIRNHVWEYNDARRDTAGPAWEHDVVPSRSGFSLPSTRGRLLVAAPPLSDPNFDRSVVFMLDHNEGGALGLVINQPSGDLDVEIDAWMHLLSPAGQLFRGGPVDPTALIGIGLVPTSTPDGQVIESIECIEPIDLDEDPTTMGTPPTKVRIFHGYAGWGPQQLDGELEMGAWIVLTALASDVFTNQPHDLWRTVLARQRGEVAWLADCPADPSAN
jgi:putative transcriptional regulator